MAHAHVVDISQESRFLEGFGRRGFVLAGGIGLAALAISFLLAGVLEGGMRRLWWSYLHSWTYFTSLSLGALFFVMIHHVTKAGWSVLLRRVAEGFAAAIVVMVLLFVPLLFGLGDLYHWLDPEVMAHDYVLKHKAGYLNLPFFGVRLMLYFAFWCLASWMFLRTSVRQDTSGDPGLSLRLERLSAPFLLLYALTVTFAAFDLLMSLDGHWYSTIFGVYFFAGAVVAWFAFMPLIFAALQRQGILATAVTPEHYHDVGKFLFGFIVFWAYIAFSQFMLIWYANLPEETGWYLRRQVDGWQWVGLSLVFFHFALPFLVLLPRGVKRKPALLVTGGLIVLVMHFVDLYYIIMPEFDHELTGIPFSVLDITCWIGIGGLFVAGALRILQGNSLVPERDPRLEESMSFENV